MNIGPRICFYRRSRKLTQSQLAARLDMAPEQLCRYEKGYVAPSLAVLHRIGEALRIPLSELVRESF
jgi:transcriptional regulator with XRE-family HTH domain